MKIDIKYKFTDDDLKVFTHIKENPVILTIDTDYIEDEDDLKSAIADEMYHKYQIVLNTVHTELIEDYWDIVNDVESIAINNKEAIKNAISEFLALVKSSGTPLEMRKAYNNQILAFGNNGNLSKLCSPLGLAEEILNYIVENANATCEDLMALVEYIYKIERSVDSETQFFGFLLKVKGMSL